MKRWLGLNRIFLLFALVLLGMGATTPDFLTWQNLAIVMKGVSVNALLATGFTIVLITRHLDLSIGATLTLGAMVTAGMQPQFGWFGGAAAGLACGLAVGLANGFLVTKAKVDSFITTLGTMIIVTGIGLRYSRGGTIFVQDFAASDWLERPLAATGAWTAFASPLVLMAVGVVAAFEWFLKRTVTGRQLFMLGGNPKTAFYSGLAVDRLLLAAFAVSGLLAAFGGVLTAVQLNSAEPGIGNPSLMMVIAAVIVGGASMEGGRGSVCKSLVALFTINMVAVGFNRHGAGPEAINIANGVMLGAIILFEAVQIARQRRIKGRRHELMERLEEDFGAGADSDTKEEETTMHKKDHTLSIVCVSIVGCVAIVAMFLMYLIHHERGIPGAAGPLAPPAQRSAAAPATGPTQAADLRSFKAADGQPLLPEPENAAAPPRPADPAAFPETDPQHWHDQEFAVWNVKREPMPGSPADGPAGKNVVYLKFVDHPYLTAMSRGMQKVADATGVKLTTLCADNDTNKQKVQVDQVAAMKPDLVIFNAVSPKAAAPLVRKLHQAGIPVIASNQICSHEALKYCLTWTGPDDWGQFRMLARKFAELMNYEGGYAIVRHFPGNSCYDSRTYGIITELKKIAPKMELLEMQTTNLEMIETEKVVSGWITRHGRKLKGVASADDSGAQLGINKACKNAGRNDIIRVAAGNSKVGMEAIKSGELHAVTYQSAEADGAIPMSLAVKWFNGESLPEVQYLPRRIITAANVDQYLPPQW